MMQSAQATGRDSSSPRPQGMDRWVDHVLGAGYRRYCPGEPWAPSINLYEGGKQYYMVVDLAGVVAEEIDLRVDEGFLLLSGSRATPTPPRPCGQVRLHLMEIDHGRFCRSVKLPPDADLSDVEAIDASYRSGLLWVRIPKRR